MPVAGAVSPDQVYHTAPTTPDQEQPPKLMHLSAQAAEGTSGPATFSLLLVINGKRAVALVDSGSYHTFMNHQRKCL